MSLFAAEFEEPKIGISGRRLTEIIILYIDGHTDTWTDQRLDTRTDRQANFRLPLKTFILQGYINVCS